MLEVEHAQEIANSLRMRDIIIDTHLSLLRVSPYFYNTIEENAIFVDALTEVLGKKKI
jgi:selenocysteine lyase/cysteine desulfurase